MKDNGSELPLKIQILIAVGLILLVCNFSLMAYSDLTALNDEYEHGESICNWAYSAGYRHGYGNQSSLHDAIKPEYQACYDEGYNDGLADYQSNIGGQP